MDIKRHLNNEPIVARPPSNLYRFRTGGRNKLAFARGFSGPWGALVAGLALATFGLIQARTQRNEARASEKWPGARAAKSEQVASFLEDMLRGVGASRALGATRTCLAGDFGQNRRACRHRSNQPA